MTPTRLLILGASCALLTATAAAQTPQVEEHNDSRVESTSPNEHYLRLGTLDQTRHWTPMIDWTLEPLDSNKPISKSVALNIYNATVYQNVSRTIGQDKHNSVFNRFDMSLSIALWSLEGHGLGTFTTSVRVNNNVLDTATAKDATGALGSLDVIASDQSFLLNRFEFRQELFDRSAVLTIGKGNPNDSIASNIFAWDEVNQFMAAAFDGGNYPTGYSGYMPIVSLQTIPTSGIYISGAVTSGLGSNYQLFSTAGEGLYWCAAEAGVVVEVEPEKLQGRYSIAVMNSNTGNDTTDYATRASGNAIAFVAQQELNASVTLWSQYLLSSGRIGPAEQELTVGLSMDSCFGREDDACGIAIGWTRPSREAYPGWRENIQLEAWYRLQLTNCLQLTPDVQLLARPSDPAATDEPVWAVALRLVVTF